MTEGNLLFSVKVQLWLQAAQVELSWLWHKSSGAIWLILLQLHKTSKGHKPPKQGSMGVWNIILSQWPRLFSHAGEDTPLVSSTLIHLPLFKSPHQLSLHPPICYRTKSLTPSLEGMAFVCGWQPIKSIRAPGAAVLQRNHLSTKMQTVDCIKQITLITSDLWEGQILNLSNICVICQKSTFKNKDNESGIFSPKRKFWHKSTSMPNSLLSWISFMSVLTITFHITL